MNFPAKTTLLSTALSLTVAFSQAHASVVQPQLAVQPIAATTDAQDLMLHADDNGSTFLYVEEQQGAMLAVYDVTDPAHIQLDASVPTEAHTSFDFVRTLGYNELIAFRDGSGNGMIDMRKAKAPKLVKIVGRVAGGDDRGAGQGGLPGVELPGDADRLGTCGAAALGAGGGDGGDSAGRDHRGQRDQAGGPAGDGHHVPAGTGRHHGSSPDRDRARV